MRKRSGRKYNKYKVFVVMLVVVLLAAESIWAQAAEPEVYTENPEANASETGEADIPDIVVAGDTDSIVQPNVVNQRSPESGEIESAEKSQNSSLENDSVSFVADGALEYNTPYQLDSSLLDYTSVYDFTRQYVCEEAGGVYFLQENQLYFLNLSTGGYQNVYTFDYESDDVYRAGNTLYWGNGRNQILEYDLVSQKMIQTITIDGVSSSSGLGVDASGRIYLGVSETSGDVRKLYLLSPDGTLLDSMEMDRTIYEFSGFDENGSFYFVAYRNWVYWGYEHDMKALFTCTVKDNQFQEDSLGCIENVGQIYYNEYQDFAAVLGGHFLADHLGNVYDVSDIGNGNLSFLMAVNHEADEEFSSASSSVDLNTALSSIGVRMVYQPRHNSLIGYTSDRNLYEYDIDTGKKLGRYKTAHYVFNLMDYQDDSMIAIEREGGIFYIELIKKTDIKEVQTVTIHLNEGETYASHTEDAVRQQWEQAQIPANIQVYQSSYSLSPYQEAVFTDEMKEALLTYSNYLRWLGGLTPFESAGDEAWTHAAKGAVVLTKTGELTHSPSQPEDMEDEFYEAAYDGCSNSNLYGGGVSEGRPDSFEYYLKGWLDDTANIGSYELGHRFTFLQRAGYQIAYGSTDRYMAQTVQAYSNQENTTGTISGVDNNDYCYTWPGTGYFPGDAISTAALWSVNLNSDKITPAQEGMTVEIKDLASGTVTDVTESLGSSAYYGFNSYFGYFYGECFYFDPPEASSYYGKNYEVTLSGMELSNGDPAKIVYTVQFIDARTFLKGDINDDKSVNLMDLMMCLNHVSKKSTLVGAEFTAADIDDNGAVNLMDLMRILNYVSKKTVEL